MKGHSFCQILSRFLCYFGDIVLSGSQKSPPSHLWLLGDDFLKDLSPFSFFSQLIFTRGSLKGATGKTKISAIKKKKITSVASYFLSWLVQELVAQKFVSELIFFSLKKKKSIPQIHSWSCRKILKQEIASLIT